MTHTHRASPVQWRPRYESKPYRMHPGRREHIHGPIVGLDPPPSKSEVIWIKLGIIAGVIAGLGAYYYGY